MNGTEFQAALTDILNNLTADEAINLFNAVCDDYGDPHDKIYYMSDFDDVVTYQFSMTPLNIIRQLDEDFDTAAEFFAITDDGIVSFDDLDDDEKSPFNADLIIDAIVDTGNDYDNEEIAAALAEVEA